MVPRFILSHTSEPQNLEVLPAFFNRLRLPHLQMGADSTLACEIYEDDLCLFVVLGHVYLERLDVDRLEMIFRKKVSCSGVYAIFKYIKADHSVEVVVDKYGVYPLFKRANGLDCYYSNRFDILLKVPELNVDLDLGSLRFFFKHGYCRSGDTFFKGLKKIAGKGIVDIEPPTEPVDTQGWLLQFDRTLSEALSDITRFTSVKDFRLSGGLDTRVISLCLKRVGFNPEAVTVVQSPHLPEGQDQDVELARMLVKRLGWGLRVLRPRPEENEYSFLSGSKPSLSGVYGGEFFGGQCLKEMPTPVAFNREGYLQAIDVFLNSFRSTIYKNNWRSPYANHYKMISPFSDSRVLDLIVQLSPSSLKDYRLYHKYYNLICGDFKDIPLCSMLYYWFDDLPHPSPTLKNSKHVPSSLSKKIAPEAYETDLFKTALETFNSEVPQGDSERLSNVAFLAQGLLDILSEHQV